MKWLALGVSVVIGVYLTGEAPRETGCETETVVVTGTSGGLGKAIKEGLEKAGFVVIGASRSEGIDLRSPEAVKELKRRVKNSTLVGLINNAGTYTVGDVSWDNRDYVSEISDGRVYEAYVQDELVNVRAVINVTGGLMPELLEGASKCGSATVVNVGSINGVLSLSDTLPYGATKGAIEMWTDALRRTLKPKNIRVTALQPGLVRTAMCPDAYCEPADKTCVPAVLSALTKRWPKSRYTCAMRTGSTGVFFDWPELFFLQKHAPTFISDWLLPSGMMIDCQANPNSRFCAASGTTSS